MARHAGRFQLEQSDMHLSSNMAKIANGGFSRTALEAVQYLIKKPCAEVHEEKKPGVEFPGHNKVKPGIERYPVILHSNHSNGCLRCHNGRAQNAQTHWGLKATSPPSPEQHRQLTPEPTTSLPGMPAAPPGFNEVAQHSQIDNLPPGYLYFHTPLPSAQLLNIDAYALDSQPDTDYNLDMLTDEGTSNGLYTHHGMIMQLTFILQRRVAC